MEELKTVQRFKLLTPKKGSTFKDDVITARQANGDTSETHLLHERLVFSFLAYRSRFQLPASVREISEHTRLHHKSVTSSLAGLSASVNKVGKKWVANRPPQSWFATRSQDATPDQWADDYAYVTYLVPKRGATIRYPQTTRRFGINHAAVYSFLVNRGKKPGGVVKRFTVSGQATMLGISRPTVKSVIDDLLFAGFIGVADLGSSFDITLKTLNDDLISYFTQKPVAKEIHATEKKPRDVERYEMKADGFDDWRKSCKWLMPQSSCEEAITIAKQLGDCLLAFRDQIRVAREQHNKNKLKGGIGRGNFGKYFVTRMNTRLEEKQRQERELEAQANLQEFLQSDEHKEAMEKRDMDAAADPLHDFHHMSEASILDRVQIADSPLTSLREAKKIMDQVYDRCREHLNRNGDRVEPTKVLSLSHQVLAHALAALNGHYKSETLATPNQLKEQIDTVLVVNNLKPVFGEFKEVANV